MEENLRNGNIKKLEKKNNLYDCKCEFYWKVFLKFVDNLQFEEGLRKLFNLCSAKCPMCESNETYCSEKLWHEPLKSEDDNDKNYWISFDGYKFNCKHSIPCHTIFIIDTSTSMNNSDIKPEIFQNNKNYYNRLGCVINVIDNYIKVRIHNNIEDIFSFIKFNSEAKIIIEEINVERDKINIMNECMNKIEKLKKVLVI